MIYQSKKGGRTVTVQLVNETVWLTQKQMGELFGKNTKTINEHIQHVYKEQELEKKSTIRKFRVVQKEGKRAIEREIEFYNLDVIISVGYRVKSQEGTSFRIWANRVLRDHLTKGFTINKNRLPDSHIRDLENAFTLIKQAINLKQLNSTESVGLLEVITTYADTWIWLQKFDEETLYAPKHKQKPHYELTYEDAKSAIAELKIQLRHGKETIDLFGNEREHMLEGVVRSLYQTYASKELYPTVEEKAAHLLYFIIKDHPFTDGNKRIASLLFILFLSRNQAHVNTQGQPKFNNAALVALALLVAQSDPDQKETIIALIMNCVAKK